MANEALDMMDPPFDGTVWAPVEQGQNLVDHTHRDLELATACAGIKNGLRRVCIHMSFIALGVTV